MTSEREARGENGGSGHDGSGAGRGKRVRVDHDAKNAAPLAMADEIEAQTGALLAQNALDVEVGRSKGLSPAVLDRLRLSRVRVAALTGVRAVAALPDPVVRPSRGACSQRAAGKPAADAHWGSGRIYEARPNVTVDTRR